MIENVYEIPFECGRCGSIIVLIEMSDGEEWAGCPTCKQAWRQEQ